MNSVRNRRSQKEASAQWFPFIPFSQETPETLITWTCEHTKNPTYQSGYGTHPGSHGNVFNTLQYIRLSPVWTRSQCNLEYKNQQVKRVRGSIYSHPESPRWQWYGTCHVSPDDTSNLRNRDRYLMGGGWGMGGQIRFTKTQNTGEKLVLCTTDSENPAPFSQLSDSVLLPSASGHRHTSCGLLKAVKLLARSFYECWLDHSNVCGKSSGSAKKIFYLFCLCGHLTPPLNAWHTNVIPVEHLLFDH